MLPNPFSKLLLTTMLIVITIILLSGCSVTTNPSNEWYMSAIKPKGEKHYDPPGGSYDFSPGGLIADIYHSLEGLVVTPHPLNIMIVMVIKIAVRNNLLKGLGNIQSPKVK